MEKACGLHCTKINNIGVKIGDEEILKDVSIHIHCGELTVIIGRNGAGKSTLLKAILGEIEHTGNITFVDQKDNITKRIKIGYVPQSINVEKHMPTTVYDLFASCITHIPVFLKKDKKIYSEIKEHLKIFGADGLKFCFRWLGQSESAVFVEKTAFGLTDDILGSCMDFIRRYTRPVLMDMPYSTESRCRILYAPNRLPDLAYSSRIAERIFWFSSVRGAGA